MSRLSTRRLLLIALFAAGLAGCNALRDMVTRLPGPRLYEKGAEVIGGIRAFEYRMGFHPTENFLELDKETESYPFCGFVSRLYLPYSYVDPGIQWRSVDNEAECRLLAGEGTDIYFGQSEAAGQIGTPVTGAMLAGSLVRFVYLVIHEDCHDQFDLPQGIEEALCNVITYHGMVAYAEDKERPGVLERAAMRRYAERESERTRQAKAAYEDLERLYVRHARNELATPALMEERARIFARAERALDRGSLNNVGIANDMTYSRHFPYLESVFEAQGRDLARTVAFFRRVDALKPARAAFLKQQKLKTEESVEFVRAYEAAVLQTIARELAIAGK
jgi:hypothetical protein